MTDAAAMTVFDPVLVRKHRARAAARFADHDFLFQTVNERLRERLLEIRRSFPLVLSLGAHGLNLPDARTITLDPCLGFRPDVVAEPEWLPCHGPAFDLVTSTLFLHWVNDLPGALAQAARALKPDGLFLAALLGGDTLFELRHSLMEAELELTGGLAARFSPLMEVRDAGHLLQRAGLALPVADRETITVTYADPLKLLHDLRGMGATHAPLAGQRLPLRRDVLALALAKYREKFAGSDGRVPATFEVLYLTGWSPATSQPQPLARGSGRHSLAAALNSVEKKGEN